MQQTFYDGMHKALRRELMLLTIDADTIEADDLAGLKRLAGRSTALTSLLLDHLQHEARFLRPLVTRANPELAETLTAKAPALEVDLAELGQSFSTTLACAEAERSAAFQRARRDLARVMRTYLAHMRDVDEGVLSTPSQACSSEESAQAFREWLGAIGTGALTRLVVVMMPALTSHEQVEVFAGLRQQISPDAYQSLLSVAQAVLSDSAGRTLEERLAAA